MNKLAKAIAVIGTIGLAGGASALTPATFNITVDMGGSALSVVIVSGAPVALGTVTASQILGNPLGTPVVVRNDSSGLIEDYEISVSNSVGGWTIGAAQASDTATLHVLFNALTPTTLPGLGDFLAADQLSGGALPVLSGTLGTEAFVGTQESSADAAYRAALAAAFTAEQPRPTTFTQAISGRTARGFANRLTALGAAAGAPATPGYPMTYDAGKALHAAAKASGNSDYAAQWAGQAVPLARAMPAAELVATLTAELKATLERLSGLKAVLG